MSNAGGILSGEHESKDRIPHSQSEPRYTALGKTNGKRLLTIIFTVRNEKIRVISTRDMHKKERKFYNEKAEEDSKV